MKSYNTLNDYYRNLFGEKTFKVPIDAGFDCPNRDGTVAHGGCTFCTVSGSGDAIVAPDAPIREQFYKEIDLCTVSGQMLKSIWFTSKILPIHMKSWK